MDFEYWQSYIYLYGIGGILFFGAIYLGFRKKVISLKHSDDRKLFIGFLIAYFSYAIFHAIWNLYAIKAMS